MADESSELFSLRTGVASRLLVFLTVSRPSVVIALKPLLSLENHDDDVVEVYAGNGDGEGGGAVYKVVGFNDGLPFDLVSLFTAYTLLLLELYELFVDLFLYGLFVLYYTAPSITVPSTGINSGSSISSSSSNMVPCSIWGTLAT